MEIGALVETLLGVEDEAWGRYAFSRDLLNRRIGHDAREDMIAKAMACGRSYAVRMSRETGCNSVKELAEHLNLKVTAHEGYRMGDSVWLARYTPPDGIEIMEEPVRKAVSLAAAAGGASFELFRQDDIMNIILGHEIFHYIEDRFEQEIYTRTEKLLLWNFLGYRYYSTIRALGEIAAAAFTQEMNRLHYSPFLLDVLLYFSYDPSSAETIYRDVLGASSGRCRETVEDYK